MLNLILGIICGVFLSLYLKEKQKTRNVISINELRREENQKLEEENHNLLFKAKEIEQQIISRKNALETLENVLESMQRSQEEVIRVKADTEYHNYKEVLEQEYQEVLNDLINESGKIRTELKLLNKELEASKAKQAAYIEQQKKKEEMLAKKDYYRLNLSKNDLDDIDYLRKAQTIISHKEAIDKVIWDVYYKPAYDILMTHVFPNKKDKVCGIYKITCLTTDKAYVGQSVDIKERFKQHIKSSISYLSTSNKLYSEMKLYSPTDFLFELLEEVPRTDLNEREIYYIDLYKTNEFGLNSTKGGS